MIFLNKISDLDTSEQEVIFTNFYNSSEIKQTLTIL